MLLPVAELPCFSWLNSIWLCVCTTSSLSAHLLVRVGYFQVLWLPPGRWAPKSPSYIAKRIYIHESHKIIANKGAAFKQEWKQLPQILTYVKYRENRQNIHIPASPCEGFKLHAFPAASKGLASNQPASRCWLWCSLLEHWWILAQPQLLRTTKKKMVECKGLRGNQKLGLGFWQGSPTT